MSWKGSIRWMVLREFADAARLRGAHCIESDEPPTAPTEPPPTDLTARRRRIVTRRAA